MSEQSITFGARLVRDLERALEEEYLRGFAAGRAHDSEVLRGVSSLRLRLLR